MPGRRVERALAALALLAAPGLSVSPGAAAGGAAEPSAPGCAHAVLRAPQPAGTGHDDLLWRDRCGAAFYAERPPPPGREGGGAAVRRAGAPMPLPAGRTFLLSSRPGAARTLYLRFTGETLRGTAWNADFGLETIVAEPFSITPPADTEFTAAELGAIQRAWLVTAEDFAPFDVNVTTRPPAADALARSSVEDQAYGATVLVTHGGPVFRACTCGGLAYVDVFDAVGPERELRQPAMVFAGRSGESIGEAASHEAGHTFGLLHDGSAAAAYYAGRAPWAPIMGSAYAQPVSQWSEGEYAGATNPQDDLATIAEAVPLRADDHGDDAGTATPLGPGAHADGVISTRADVDAFSFRAGGRVAVTVTGAPLKPNLDVRLRVLDAHGDTIAVVDPPAGSDSPTRALGLDATWRATLPDAPATYTVLVDGVGTGSPLEPGRYSDYGSLGQYRVSVATRRALSSASRHPAS